MKKLMLLVLVLSLSGLGWAEAKSLHHGASGCCQQSSGQDHGLTSYEHPWRNSQSGKMHRGGAEYV